MPEITAELNIWQQDQLPGEGLLRAHKKLPIIQKNAGMLNKDILDKEAFVVVDDKNQIFAAYDAGEITSEIDYPYDEDRIMDAIKIELARRRRVSMGTIPDLHVVLHIFRIDEWKELPTELTEINFELLTGGVSQTDFRMNR